MIHIRKRSLIFWGSMAVILGASVFWIWAQQTSPQGGRAKITHAGKTEYISLNQDGIYSLKSDPAIHFQVQNGAIRFVDADCPDKICEKAGYLSKKGETAACLPRDTVLVIQDGEEGEVDAVAG